MKEETMATTEQLMADKEQMAERMNERARNIETNIAGIQKKLDRKDVPEDMKRLLRYNLDKAYTALRVCQEGLSDFTRI